MTETAAQQTPAVVAGDSPPPVAIQRDARGWITNWDADDEAFWAHDGRRVARRNLVLSVFAEHIGFSIWVLWTVIVVNLGNVGISLTLSQQFWLTAVPNLIGSALRLPYTFAIPRFGGRRWTAFSAGLLLIPCLLAAIVVPSGWLRAQSPSMQFWVLLVCAATAGVGGGNFSSSMANISFFFPERAKGLALGINAAGGNLGVAVAQLVVPLVVIVGVPATAVRAPVHPVYLAYAGLVWLPFIVVAMIGAAWKMDSLAQARTDTSSYVAALRAPQTWIMSLLYIGTFGSFIGFSFALPVVIKNTFPSFLAHHSFVATYLAGLAFLGALVGSLSRPFGGWLADRWGGARVTIACFVAMSAATGVGAMGVRRQSFAMFLGSYLVVFLLAGMDNGSTYRMIPTIFRELGRRRASELDVEPHETALEFKRRAAAVIGIAGAIGAFGGFLIQVVLRQSSLHVSALMKAATTPAAKAQIAATHSDWSLPALETFLIAYLVLAALTWWCYLRSQWFVRRVPSLADARI